MDEALESLNKLKFFNWKIQNPLANINFIDWLGNVCNITSISPKETINRKSRGKSRDKSKETDYLEEEVKLKAVEKQITIEDKNIKDGVIFTLSNKGNKVYIGYDFTHNIEKNLKDLVVRFKAYEEFGYLYESSYEIFKNGPANFEIIVELSIKSKLHLAEHVLQVIKKYGSRCVNIWNPVDMLTHNKPVSIINTSKNIDKFIDMLDKKKEYYEFETITKYIEDGYTDYDAVVLMKEEYSTRMKAIRESKSELYNEMIIY
jgi:hypothetical protein